jgi:ferritin-like metal-binding protein YciE
MALASLKDLYFDELGDLYDAETQMIRTLPRLADAARAPELREALRKHCDESRLHLERLELIFTHWGERRHVKACAGLAGIVQEADDRLNEAATEDVRDAAIIGVAQRIEHYEIAAYGCARTYARRLNRLDEARLLQETLDEEGRADHRLTELAESRINDDARRETDFMAPQARPLQYVPMDVVAERRGSREPLAILNDADEKLGVLDGLVAESDLGAARYAVVDAGGVLSRRRYLLPLHLLRFDDRARVLRVSIDKAVAERYPVFDGDEFETMSEADRSGYEARLLAFFRRDNGRTAPPADPVGSLPEWLLKGTWITLPPQHVERLPEEARSFVNEFAPAPAERGDAPPGGERMIAHDREPEAPLRHDEGASASGRRLDN